MLSFYYPKYLLRRGEFIYISAVVLRASELARRNQHRVNSGKQLERVYVDDNEESFSFKTSNLAARKGVSTVPDINIYYRDIKSLEAEIFVGGRRREKSKFVISLGRTSKI